MGVDLPKASLGVGKKGCLMNKLTPKQLAKFKKTKKYKEWKKKKEQERLEYKADMATLHILKNRGIL